MLGTIERERCTSLNIVGDAFARPLVDELGDAATDLSSLRHVITGGAILSPAIKERAPRAPARVRDHRLVGSSESGRRARPSSPADAATSRAASFRRRSVVLDDDRQQVARPGRRRVGWLATAGRIPLGYLGDAAEDGGARSP